VAGEDSWPSFFPQSVVIDDLHRVGIPVLPDEANAVLIVDPDAMLAAPLSCEPFEPVPGKGRQITEFARGVQLPQLPLDNPGDVLQPPGVPAREKRLGLGILERPDHCSPEYNAMRYMSSSIVPARRARVEVGSSRRRSSHRDDDLPLVIAAPEAPEGLRHVREWVHAIDDRHECAGFKQLVDEREILVGLQDDDAQVLALQP